MATWRIFGEGLQTAAVPITFAVPVTAWVSPALRPSLFFVIDPPMSKFPTTTFVPLSTEPRNQTLVVFAAEGQQRSGLFEALDAKTNGTLKRAMEVADYKPKRKSMLEVLAPTGLHAGRVLIAGIGNSKTITLRDWLEIGGAVRGKLGTKAVAADVIFSPEDGISSGGALQFALGFTLRNYSFKKYKTSRKSNGDPDGDEPAPVPHLELPVHVTIFAEEADSLRRDFEASLAVSEGVYLARDLVNEPANVLTPPEFTARLRALQPAGLAVEVLDEAALKALGMNALLAVGQGSAQPTSAVVLRWDGAGSRDRPGGGSDAGPVVFIGKGVCFDTGGISIKPGPGMEEMKGDMAGAAAVAGVMLALAKRHAPVNAIGLVGLVENMPSGTAFRPGDVLTAASGHTIEVQNTDAEGRLVLADLLWYAQTHLKPRLMVTLATLTGAIIVALGKENAGLFANDDALSQRLTEAGLDTGETVWRLPLSAKYNKLIDSKIADMKNIGGREAGSITAAQFLQRFVDGGAPWAHLDVAGTGMSSPASDINTSWASGFGVRLLNRFSEKFYEGQDAAN